jgi:hypothetical protein
VYETKFQPLLKSDNILGADCIRAPQRLIEIFAVPTSEFRSAVIDVIKRPTPFEDTLELAKVSDITTRIQRDFDVGTQAETDLVRLVMKIARDDMMPAVTEFRDQTCSDGSKSASYEYPQ